MPRSCLAGVCSIALCQDLAPWPRPAPREGSPVLVLAVPVWCWGRLLPSPRDVMSPHPRAPLYADVPDGQLLAWELVELEGRVRAAGHPAQGEEGVEHLSRHLSRARRGPASGWSRGSPLAIHSHLLALQFGQAVSFPAAPASVLSCGVFAPSKPTSLTGSHSSFLSSCIKRGDRGHAAHQWQSWGSPSPALPDH